MRLQQLIAMLPTEKVMITYSKSGLKEDEVFTVAEACQAYLRERQKSKRLGARFLRSLSD